jgi:hypothetical protein
MAGLVAGPRLGAYAAAKALTHPDWYPVVAERHEAIAAAFREQEALRQEAGR